MLEPVPNAKRVFFIDLNSDLTKVASDLGLGLLPDEMEKVKECHEARNPRFVSQTKARSMLDPKNFGILEHVLAQEIE